MSNQHDAQPIRPNASFWYWLWPTLAVLLLLAAGGLGLLMAAGQIEVRFPCQAASPPTAQPAQPDGPRVERVKDAGKYFAICGWEAVVYEYAGGFVDLWLETEIDGGKPVVEELGGASLAAMAAEARPRPEEVHGTIVLLRRTVDATAEEVRADKGPAETPPGKKQPGHYRDLHMTAAWSRDEAQGAVSLTNHRLPDFTQFGSFIGSGGGGLSGGALRPGEDLVLYEKREQRSVEPGNNVSTRVVRLKCRLTPSQGTGK